MKSVVVNISHENRFVESCGHACISYVGGLQVPYRHMGTWLRDDHSGKFCRKFCYSVVLQVIKRKNFADQQRKQHNCSYTKYHKKLLLPQSWMGMCSQALGTNNG